MNDLTRLELMKLPADKRPSQAEYNQYMNHNVYNGGTSPALHVWKEDEVPKTWSVFDGKLVKQLMKLWEEHEWAKKAQQKATTMKGKLHPGPPVKKWQSSDGWDEEPEYAGDI